MTLLSSALLLSTALAIVAAEAPPASAPETPEQEIIVIGQADGYLATDGTTALKTRTPLKDTPQTITVLTREQLDDQAILSIGEALRYVPGTTVGQGEGNRDQVTIRGQNTTADFFLDGVRDDVQYFRPLYNLERVEVLKGPAALTFGRGGGGGVINRVQKTPLADQFAFGADASVNSFGATLVSADLNAPIAPGAALRVNAMAEGLESFRDFVDGERFAINPYAAAELGRTWRVGLSYEYLDDDRVTDRGVPSLDNRPITNARDTFFGVPGVNRTTLQAHVAKLRVEGEIAPGVTLDTTLLYGNYDKLYTNVFPNGAVRASDGTFALGAYTDTTTRENLIGQGNLIWTADLGGARSTLLIGVEVADQSSRNARLNGTLSSARISVVDPVYPTVRFDIPANDRRSDVDVFSVYAQDQFQIGTLVEIVAGLRYDRFEIAGVDFAATPDRPFGRTDDKVSPRFGLILKPTTALSLYGSYSRSFLPRSGDQFLALSTTQQNLAPEAFTNYEVGAKWAIRPDLTATVALFRLDRTNATTPDPLNPALSINIGATRTEGVEVGLAGRITPKWQVSGGYSYQDAVLRGNDAVRLGQVPRHQASLWNRYQVAPAIGIGLGVVHQGSQFAAIRTSPATTRLPAFTRVDAALSYTIDPRFDIQVNVENLFDTDYFSDAHNNNNVTPGAPINARVTLRARL